MPVIAVTGPWQSGKSTLMRQVFPAYAYSNLEDIEQRNFAKQDPKGFLKNHLHRNIHPGQYFWHASGSHEIDLLLHKGGRLLPIEIKSGRTINSTFFDSLKYFQSLSGALPEDSFLIYGGDERQQRSIANVLGWRHLGELPL